MRIPADKLPDEILRRVIEEFVSRDGTDWSEMEARVSRVLRQLESGKAELHFDEESGTTNVVTRDNR
jgi:uncharacterized protein